MGPDSKQNTQARLNKEDILKKLSSSNHVLLHGAMQQHCNMALCKANSYCAHISPSSSNIVSLGPVSQKLKTDLKIK